MEIVRVSIAQLVDSGGRVLYHLWRFHWANCFVAVVKDFSQVFAKQNIRTAVKHWRGRFGIGDPPRSGVQATYVANCGLSFCCFKRMEPLTVGDGCLIRDFNPDLHCGQTGTPMDS